MKHLAALLAATFVAATLPGVASANSLAAIDAIRSLRQVDRVAVIDVAAESDPLVNSKRAMLSRAPLTPLQVAIANSAPLVAKIDSSVWSFDLRSVYAANVVGGTVYIYLGSPPP